MELFLGEVADVAHQRATDTRIVITTFVDKPSKSTAPKKKKHSRTSFITTSRRRSSSDSSHVDTVMVLSISPMGDCFHATASRRRRRVRSRWRTRPLRASLLPVPLHGERIYFCKCLSTAIRYLCQSMLFCYQPSRLFAISTLPFRYLYHYRKDPYMGPVVPVLFRIQ